MRKSKLVNYLFATLYPSLNPTLGLNCGGVPVCADDIIIIVPAEKGLAS
jgi:hypothetical protein